MVKKEITKITLSRRLF